MDFPRAVSTASIDDRNAVIVRVAFPEFSFIKLVRCEKNLPIGEIKAAFHQQFKFEDELYSIFIPAVDAKGVLSFADGRWCDDVKLVQDYNLQPMAKIILAKRFVAPTSPSQQSPIETKKSRRLSRRILGFFGASDSKSSQQAPPQPQPQPQPQRIVVDASDSGGSGTFASAAEEEEFMKFANSFAQRASRQALASSAPSESPSVVVPNSMPAPVIPGPKAQLTKSYSVMGTSSTRQRRMTFDVKNLGSVLSMEKESNPLARRRQLVTFLSEFLNARVSIDELISSGIISVDPPPAVVDQPINIEFVRKIFDWILVNGIVEGIFRVSGPSQDVDSATDVLNKGLLLDLKAELNPHLVASVLKKYIRDRPFATVPYRCYRSAVLKHDSLPDKYVPFSVEECKAFIDSLPDDKPDLFRLVVTNLKKLSAFQEKTKMGMSNLAIVWAPVLMRCHGDGLSAFSESDRQTDFLIRIIEVIDGIVKDEDLSDAMSLSPGEPDEKSPEKSKRRKHHHHHHHRHGHSHSRSSRRKTGSANSSPVSSPVLAPIDLCAISPRTPRTEGSSTRKLSVPGVETNSSQKGSDAQSVETPSSTTATESPSSVVDLKLHPQGGDTTPSATTPSEEGAKPQEADVKPSKPEQQTDSTKPLDSDAPVSNE